MSRMSDAVKDAQKTQIPVKFDGNRVILCLLQDHHYK